MSDDEKQIEAAKKMFPGLPGHVFLKKESSEDAIKWINQFIDGNDWRYWGNGLFLFRNESHAVEFKLRWCDEAKL